MNNEVIVTNIQRFSLHDGPGIRTTIFFKGCTLKCPWCANPENINFQIEKYEYENDKGIYGYKTTLDNVYNEIIKDYNYYQNDGGVTFSGGEPLMQIEKIKPLLNKLKEVNINICFETSLFVPQDFLKLALEYCNEIIVDLKILDSELCLKILGSELKIYKNNINYLFNNYNCDNIIMRIPVTKEYVLNEKYMEKYIDFVQKYKPKRVEIFKIHHLGDKKYKTLRKPINYFEEVSDIELNDFKKRMSEYCKVEILKI